MLKAKVVWRRLRSPEITCESRPGSDIGVGRLSKPVPKCLGPSATRLKTVLFAGRAARAGLSEGTENAGISKTVRFHRCTGKLNATQPRVLAVSTSYIRGLGSPRKGSVVRAPQSSLFTGCHLKEPLTLYS